MHKQKAKIKIISLHIIMYMCLIQKSTYEFCKLLVSLSEHWCFGIHRSLECVEAYNLELAEPYNL